MPTLKVTVGAERVRGVVYWRLRYWRDGKPRREFFKTKTAAVAEANRIREERQDSGAAWLELPPHERQQLMLAYHEAKRAGVDIFAVIREAKGGATLRAPAPLVKEVITELVLAKKKSGRDGNYVDGLETVLLHLFQELLDQRMDEISLAQTEAILNSKTLASRSTVRARMSTLFKFAMRRKYRADNPCAQLETIIYRKPPPQIFTIAEIQMAVRWLKANARHGLGWFALSTFCGLRPEEAEKTVPDRDIDFKAGLIKVEAQTTKVRLRRVVYPRAEAMAFLQWGLKCGGELPLKSQRRKRLLSKVQGPKSQGLREALGFKTWPKDITRHTAASYWLGAGATAGKVAEALGNSEKVLKRDYKALVTRAEAVAFWKVVGGFSITKKHKKKKNYR